MALFSSKFWSRCFDDKLEKHFSYDDLITDLKEKRIMEGLDMFTQEYEKDLQIDLYKWLCSVSQRLSTKYPKVCFLLNSYIRDTHFLLFFKDCNGGYLQIVKNLSF